MSKSIPELLNYNQRDDSLGGSQYVETRVILPASFDGRANGVCRFLLPKSGILDRAGFITLQCIGANPASHLCLWAGINSMVQSASLFIGGVQVQQIRAFPMQQVIKNFYHDSHYRSKVQSKINGCFAGGMSVQNNVAGKTGLWGVDLNEDWVSDTGTITEGYRLTDEETGNNASPIYQIMLQDLFKILKNNPLPLQLLPQVSLELQFTGDQHRGERTVGAGWETGSYINSSTCKLHVDIVHYDMKLGQKSPLDKVDDALKKGQSIPYSDIAYIRSQQVAGVDQEVVQTQVQCGLDNQIIRSLKWATPETPTYGVPATSSNPLLGDYNSKGSSMQNTAQVSVNAIPIYPNRLDADMKLWDQLSQCNGYTSTIKMNKALYSFGGQVNESDGSPNLFKERLTDLLENGEAQNQTMGCGHFCGVGLSKYPGSNQIGNGMAVGRNPVLLTVTDKCVTGNLGPKDIHIFVECERQMTVLNDKVVVSGS